MNLLSLADWSPDTIRGAIRLARRIKRRPGPRALAGKVLLMLFEKPSLRTRVSFEVAILQLGGHAIFYDLGSSPWRAGKESAADTARTASRYVDAIMARLFRRADLRDLAAGASVPVINGLTDFEHPTQALADVMTIEEKKRSLRDLKIAYVGDAHNNVTHSLIHACGALGIPLSVGCPRGAAYGPAISGPTLRVVHDAAEAVAGADVVYTDTWMSYHIPREKRLERFRIFRPFQVTTALMARARPDAIFMHCLPAQRGVEVTADVIDGPRSVVFDQAENRLHMEKAVLLMTVKGA